MIKNGLKIIFSGLLLFLLLAQLDFNKLKIAFYGFRTEWYILGLFLSLLMVYSQAMRWRDLIIANKNNLDLSRFVAIRLTFIGYFFNTFMPSSIGGDVAKSWYAGDSATLRVEAMTSSFLSRLLGGVILCLFFWIALPFSNWMPSKMILWIMLAFSIVLIIGVVFLATGTWYKWIPKRFERFSVLFKDLKWEWRMVVKVLPGALFLQLLVVVSQFVFFRCVNVQVPWILLFVMVPFVNLVTMIPVSLNGIGVREWAIAITLATIPNVGLEKAIASTGVAYSFVAAQALIGWFFHSFSNTKIRKVL